MMTRSDKLRRIAVCALAFAIPAGVMLTVYMAMGMAPWGDKTVLISDMSDQYVEFFCALKQGDVFFSWSKSMGTNYIGVFSYYVSSPLSVLTLLVPNENMPVGLMLLTALKLGLAGLSYAVYSSRRFPQAGITTVLCACCYGLMAYNVVYSLSIMWLDGIIWLPLILLALERVLAGRGAGPLIAALSVCFLSTWYISYMIGIFCCVYLAARLAALKPDRAALLRVLKRFFGGALCALGLTAWIWLPTFLAMYYGKFQEAGRSVSQVVYGPLSDIFTQLLPGRYATFNGGKPNLYCGTATVLLAAAYFFLKKIPLRERLANGAALAFLFLSLWFTGLDRAWHLFKFPNWFPYRYSFVASFLLICLANQALPGLWEAVGEKKKPPRALPQAVVAALLLLTVAELRGNAVCQLTCLDELYGYQSYGTYWDYYTANADLVSAAQAENEEVFYRMGTTKDRGHNAPLSFGYAGITHYSSVYNDDLNKLLKSLGLAQTWYWCASYGSTPLTDALFDIRYVMSEEEIPSYERKEGEKHGELKLWKNPDVVPLAFLQPERTGELVGDNPFDRQNHLISALIGEECQVFTPVDAGAERGPEDTVFTVTGTGRPLYADLSHLGLKEVLVNGRSVVSLNGRTEEASVRCLGAPAAGEVWTVTVRGSEGWDGRLWEFRQEALHDAVEQLNNTQVTQVTAGGRVRLTAQTDRARTLATTIPAEDGWQAYIDGVRVELEDWLGVFLALEVPAGAHEVELRYTPPGLVPGIALGLVSAMALVVIDTKRNFGTRIYRKKRKNIP